VDAGQVPAYVGILGGNDYDNPAVAIKADYFFETSAVIDPEDPVGGTRRVMVIS
jgi:hypothetical protein